LVAVIHFDAQTEFGFDRLSGRPPVSATSSAHVMVAREGQSFVLRFCIPSRLAPMLAPMSDRSRRAPLRVLKAPIARPAVLTPKHRVGSQSLTDGASAITEHRHTPNARGE